MAVTNYALGQLNPIVYFENARGEIALPPTTDDALRLRDTMSKRGWELREAGTLADVDRLQKRLQDQEYARRQSDMEREEESFAEVRRRVRDSLVSRMVSSGTRAYERDFIKSYLQLREEKRDHWRQRFIGDIAASCLTQREFDKPMEFHQKMLDRIPERKDVVCVSCGEYARVRGRDYCARCGGL